MVMLPVDLLDVLIPVRCLCWMPCTKIADAVGRVGQDRLLSGNSNPPHGAMARVL